MKKILFSILAIIACVAMTGGAFAYFTDVETSQTNTMAAGTLGIQIGDTNEGYGDTPVTASFNSPAGLAPGQEFETGPVYLKNVGSINIARIWARFGVITAADNGPSEPEGPGSFNDIQDKLKLVSYSESKNGGDWVPQLFDEANANAYLDYWNSRRGLLPAFALDGVVSLGDLSQARNYGSGDRVTSLCLMDGSGAAGPLVTGDTFAVKFKFQLVPETTNIYQGDSATFSVNFIGSQLVDYPDDTLAESITELLVP